MTDPTTTRRTVLCLTIALFLVPATPALASVVGPQFGYEGAGTVVTGIDNQGQASTITDSGGVVCEDADGDGTPDRGRGGTCIPFEAFYFNWEERVEPLGNSVHVTDDEIPDGELAFQVCVDLDGSRTCGGPNQAEERFCRDIIRYSHDTDTGEVFNPLAMPMEAVEELWTECGDNGGFPGFVVITCAGLHAHVDDQDEGKPQLTHTHEVTQGTAQPAFTEDLGQGDYCGAGPPGGIAEEPSERSREKPYTIYSIN